MKEISIIAATFYGNRGAEAMLSAAMAEIKNRYDGSVKFNVFSYYPRQDANRTQQPLGWRKPRHLSTR